MAYIRALVMSAYKEIIVSFLNQNIMLWVLKISAFLASKLENGPLLELLQYLKEFISKSKLLDFF